MPQSRKPRAIRTRFPSMRIDDQPIAAINTTPLIDLMLVLIIMFIVTLPMRENKVPLDLPTNPTPPAVPPPVHRLDLDAAGQARLDGVPIADSALRARLAAIAADPAHPALHFSPDGATRYERVDQVLADIRGAGITSLGLVDAARFEADIAG